VSVRFPRVPAAAILALLALSVGLFMLVRRGEDSVSNVAAPGSTGAATSSMLPAGEGAPLGDPVKGPGRELEAPSTPDAFPKDVIDSTVLSLVLRFSARSHAPTSVQMLCGGVRQSAVAINAHTWSLPWTAAQRPGAVAAIDFGASMRLEVTAFQQRELYIEMPPLASLTVEFPSADSAWTTEWTPENEAGDSYAHLSAPFAIDGATAVLHLRNSNAQVPTAVEQATLLAPLGSKWTLSVSASGMEVESSTREHVEVPSNLVFTGRKHPGVRVVGALPKGTLLLIYDDKDMSTPCRETRVEDLNADSTMITQRGSGLAPHSPYHLECLLPDGQRATVPFETDDGGAAQVAITGVLFDPPTIISLGEQHDYGALYIRTAKFWYAVPTRPGDFNRETGAFLLIDTQARLLRIVRSNVPWDAGYVVTTKGQVGIVRVDSVGPLLVDWFAGKAANLPDASLPSTSSTVAWQLYFAAEGVAGETTWLSIASGREGISDLRNRLFWDMPTLRLKLWSRVLDSVHTTIVEIESPFQ